MAPGIPAAMERPHFIGIGGAGMSGIAKILAQRGAKVAGSDAKESATAEALRALGATVHIGHAAGHLGRRRDLRGRLQRHPRRQPGAGRAPPSCGIPVVHRSDALASLMDGPARRSRSPAPTARRPPRRCWPSPCPRWASTRRTPSAATWTAPAPTRTHGDGRDLRRRGGRERPQLPEVRPRGRDRPQRGAGPPRQLRLDGRDLRVLRDVRRQDRARRHPGRSPPTSPGARELTAPGPRPRGPQGRHVRRGRGRRRARPARSPRSGLTSEVTVVPGRQVRSPSPSPCPAATTRTTPSPRSPPGVALGIPAHNLASALGSVHRASSAASSSRARRRASRSSTRTRTTPPR